MDKESWQTYNGILLSHKKEGTPVICDSVDELGGCYANHNKPGTEMKNIAWYHPYKASREVELGETRSTIVVARGSGGGMGSYGLKNTPSQLWEK